MAQIGPKRCRSRRSHGGPPVHRDFTDNVCDTGAYAPLHGVTPAIPTDYFELRVQLRGVDEGSFTVVASEGTACKTASDAAKCAAALAAVRHAPASVAWSTSFQGPDYYLAYTRGDTVGAVDTRAGLTAFVAPVDTAKDAALLLDALGYDFDCSASNVSATDTGFALRTRTGEGCDQSAPVDEYAVDVTREGVVSIEEKVQIAANPGCMTGRRPEGFALANATPRASSARTSPR